MTDSGLDENSVRLVQPECRRRPEVEMPEEMYEKLIGSPSHRSGRLGRRDMV